MLNCHTTKCKTSGLCWAVTSPNVRLQTCVKLSYRQMWDFRSLLSCHTTKCETPGLCWAVTSPNVRLQAFVELSYHQMWDFRPLLSYHITKCETSGLCWAVISLNVPFDEHTVTPAKSRNDNHGLFSHSPQEA